MLIQMIIMTMFVSFIISKTPMMKLMFVIMLTILIGMSMSLVQQNYLWSLIVLIVMLGGMFVMFLYISSLTPSPHPMSYKMMKSKWKMLMNLTMILSMMIISTINLNQYFIMESSMLNLSKMYSSYLLSTILIGSYLFFILLIVVIMTQYNNRPIRSK
nr:NADH dehydrogenase subunit 6 [Austropallene cornigera]UYX57773.1 NADH dehydrogenase subunit 6 [Austropallene cornigera]